MHSTVMSRYNIYDNISIQVSWDYCCNKIQLLEFFVQNSLGITIVLYKFLFATLYNYCDELYIDLILHTLSNIFLCILLIYTSYIVWTNHRSDILYYIGLLSNIWSLYILYGSIIQYPGTYRTTNAYNIHTVLISTIWFLIPFKFTELPVWVLVIVDLMQFLHLIELLI